MAVAITPNISSLFFKIFVGTKCRIFVSKKLTIIDISLTIVVFIISPLSRTALVREMLLNQVLISLRSNDLLCRTLLLLIFTFSLSKRNVGARQMLLN